MKIGNCLLLFSVLFGVVFHGQRALAQAAPVDVSLKSCGAFVVLQAHMDAAYHTVTKGYRTLPGQSQPVAQIEGVENPEKIKEFMDWFPNGGASDMMQQGICAASRRSTSPARQKA